MLIVFWDLLFSLVIGELYFNSGAGGVLLQVA